MKDIPEQCQVNSDDPKVKKFLHEYGISKGLLTSFKKSQYDKPYVNIGFTQSMMCGWCISPCCVPYISIDEFIEYCDNWQELLKATI